MYKSKLLFKTTNAMYHKEATVWESTWAFIYGVDTKTSGRFRIRVTKLAAQDLIAMGIIPEGTPPDMFGVQGNLDRWHESKGWIPCFDWVGDPSVADEKIIEDDMCKQFRSFVTGISLEEDVPFEMPPVSPPKPPKPKKEFKVPPPKKQSEEVVLPPKEDSSSEDDDSNDPDDIDWL